jgi:hypothetical protein
MLVPAEHTIKSCVKLIIIPLVDITSIDPEITHIVLLSSFPTETEFGVTSLVLVLTSN